MNPPSPPSAPRPLQAGDVIDGKYRLEHLAGEGATGQVWLATNTTLDMPVALKLLRRAGRSPRDGFPTLGDHFDANLLREAQATARVTHPSIVRVLDFGVSAAGDPFIVMERLDGEDLRDRLLRDGPCPTVPAVQLVLPLVQGMHAAHLKGIVHRDLKPENIYLAIDDSGRTLPKVVDFGIANLPWEGSVVVGTPAYMAPEQAAGKRDADFRAGIYSICVVLYELVAGFPPAASRSEGRARRGDEHGLDRLVERGVVDAALAAILRRGLARLPSARFRSMRDLGEALAEWLLQRGVEEDVQGIRVSSYSCSIPSSRPLAEEPASSHRSTPPRRRRFGITLAIAVPTVALAAAGAAGVTFAARGSDARAEDPPDAPREASRAVPLHREPARAAVDYPVQPRVETEARLGETLVEPHPASAATGAARSLGARPTRPDTPRHTRTALPAPATSGETDTSPTPPTTSSLAPPSPAPSPSEIADVAPSASASAPATPPPSASTAPAAPSIDPSLAANIR
ncbi:MAG: serine/threonine-protein kinase [Polyangiaceae bacterium]